MKKVLAITATRSEYDLLSDLYRAINTDPDLEIKLIVSGAHMSATYGSSLEDIEKDGLSILGMYETLLDSNSKLARIKSASLLMINIVDVVAGYEPDVILYAGDREEVIVGALTGAYLEIPTIHFYGGDHVADSHVDNPVRHATTKLSTLHFVSSTNHERRILNMGESKQRVFNIGSIALDKFSRENFVDRDTIFEQFGLHNGFKKYALVIFHPIPKEREFSSSILKNILLELKNANLCGFVSYPNIDPGNKELIEVINEFSSDKDFHFYKNLPRETFLGVYKNAEFIIGNSSSGILESASFKIPCINVGYRQTGRKPNENVLFVGPTIDEIKNAINKAMSNDFKEFVSQVINVYGDGKSTQKALHLIKTIDLKSMIFKDEDPIDNE